MKNFIVKKGIKINGFTVDKAIDWKLYFDAQVQKPCGVGNRYVAGCSPDERLPDIINKPPFVETRRAMLIVFEEQETNDGD